AVADAYRALAACARAPGTAVFAETTTALAAAAETVGEGPALAGERGTLRALVEQGEWIRLELVALSRSDAPGAAEILGAAASTLDAIAAGGDAASSLADLTHSAGTIDDPAARRTAATLVTWILAAVQESHAGAPGPAPRPNPLGALRAELTLRSSVFRHAVRLSVALIAAGVLYRGLSLGSGYWVPVTVLFVLKPDYGNTMTRGIARAAGTMAGVIIAGGIVTVFSPAHGTIVVLLALLACAGYALFPASYALFSVVLTVLVALLADFSGGQAGLLVRDVLGVTCVDDVCSRCARCRTRPHSRRVVVASHPGNAAGSRISSTCSTSRSQTFWPTSSASARPSRYLQQIDQISGAYRSTSAFHACLSPVLARVTRSVTSRA
ncbi:MAG: FUSC family protein, partial [Streptosporangiaceae bacterium]